MYIIMCKVVSGRLLNNTGILAWCSVMTYRGGIGAGGGREAQEEKIYVYMQLIHVVQ